MADIDSNLSHKINLDSEWDTRSRDSLGDEKVIFDGIESPGRWSWTRRLWHYTTNYSPGLTFLRLSDFRKIYSKF